MTSRSVPEGWHARKPPEDSWELRMARRAAERRAVDEKAEAAIAPAPEALDSFRGGWVIYERDELP
jgi:hypothetical protein